MTAPISSGGSAVYRDAANRTASAMAEKKWRRRNSALFIAGASALSWLLVASPFIIWG